MAVSLDVLILPAFDDLAGVPSETTPWHDRYALEGHLSIPGVPEPLAHADGIGVVPTGIGKVAAAATTTAVLTSDRVDCTDCLVLSVGVAGGNPATVTLGSVVVSTAIVDWDDKLRFDPTGDDLPLDLNPYTGDQGVVELDDDLVEWALGLAGEVSLTDDSSVATYRDRRDHSMEATPGIATGVNVCGDELWHGSVLAEAVEWLVATRNLGPPVVTEMEDLATARAVMRFHRLDRYLSIRGIANFDRPAPGATTDRFATAFEAGAPLALENAVTVADRIIDAAPP